MRKRSFAPVVRADTRLLVLGSLPGEASLEAAQYYAHPRNRFWHLMERVIDAPLVALDYPQRLDTLLAHHVGLWDAVESAQREGSLDAALREAQATDLPSLVATLPDLRAVAFNGRASEKLARPQLEQTALALIALPSSSPAHAAKSFVEKAESWDGLREFLA
ncbi:DNA-deoxyinosine glycosylase [Aurantiacibacter poecillastricola]|uniref:DNA-deoxyinosine glycosylase n=1 Tax=Aurantiacibacter poecillastricola TaxID=3064385 RepID=UPI00273D1B87|nr:DNA-deoxyinosine glycosylase [Aurantiacibacter sp. 219JJ12-13]MDP5262968.1 DNA-deoxyinosine glycosylase [Aurantiacibacter sp. 219JJ12-13]